MSIVRAAIAASAACLIGAAAYAQPMGDNGQGSGAGQTAAPSDQGGSQGQMGPSGQMGQPGDQGAQNGQMGGSADQQGMGPGAPDTAGAAANASATTDAQGAQVIASQPVPDTPANRAKYGQPMSRTGRLTRPSGD